MTPDLQGLKLAQLRLVQAVGGFEAAAGFCRLGKSQLNNATSMNHPDVFLPADVVVALEAVTVGTPGHPIVTRYLSGRAAHEILPLAVAAEGADWLALIAAISKEAGDVVSKIATCAGDGITADEVRSTELVREFEELIRVGRAGLAAALAVLGK